MTSKLPQTARVKEPEIRPFRSLPEEQERAMQQWRTGGLVNKEGLFITFFSVGIILVALLIAVKSL